MRISTKTLIVVLVCLVGAALSASVVFYHYNDLQNAQSKREISVLALRDTENFRTITSQWFVTIDLFFNAEQSYLASGIKRQAKQMDELINIIKSYENTQDNEAEFSDLTKALEMIQVTVSEASIIRDREGKKWNSYIESIDDVSIDMIDSVEILYEKFIEISKLRSISYEENKKQFDFMLILSIGIYLLFVFISWLWASINIAKPVETLNNIAKNAIVDNAGMSFELNKGSKEVVQLSRSLQDFSDKLFLSKKKSEKRKEELQESLGQLTEAKLELVQAEKMASVGNLASGVAHEINNPIGFISGNFGSLKNYTDDLVAVIEKQKECINALCEENADKHQLFDDIIDYQEEMDLEFIVSDLTSLLGESGVGLDRIKAIVSDLMEFSHVNSTDVVEVDINDLLDKTINIIGSDIIDTIDIRKGYENIPKVHCNGGKIGQVLLSVFENAIDSLSDKRIIGVKTFIQANKVYIEIQDSGCGISEENIHRVFDPFFTTKDVGEGTGLGLHTAQSILESHKGNIRVTSAEGVGTKFRIELPVSSQE